MRSKNITRQPDSKSVKYTIAGKTYKATVAFDTFWRLAAERNAITERRMKGDPQPYV
jgi:hypothetical protein